MKIPVTDNHIHVNPVGELGPIKTAILSTALVEQQ